MAATDHQNIKFHYRSNKLLMMRVNSLSVLRAKIKGEDYPWEFWFLQTWRLCTKHFVWRLDAWQNLVEKHREGQEYGIFNWMTRENHNNANTCFHNQLKSSLCYTSQAPKTHGIPGQFYLYTMSPLTKTTTSPLN